MDLERSEAKYDDGSQSVSLRASDTDVIMVEWWSQAFSVNWTARTNSRGFINYCRSLDDGVEASSVVYAREAQRYLHVHGKVVLYELNPDDIGFIRLDLPSSVAIAWQQPDNINESDTDNINESDTVGCAMPEFNSSFITSLFEETASDKLAPLAGELDNHLGFLRYFLKSAESFSFTLGADP